MGEAFREAKAKRAARQAVTTAKAVRAARSRAKAGVLRPPDVDGPALRDLLNGVAADARLVEVPASKPPWTATGLSAAAGDQVTWLAWGTGYIARPLALGGAPSQLLRVRVDGSAAQAGPGETMTFTADRSGPVEIAGVYPAELDEQGRVVHDRLPHRIMTGGFQAVVVRWPAGTDPREALESSAARDPSGLCAAEAARLAGPPATPTGWDSHPRLSPSTIYAPTDAGMAIRTGGDVGIVRREADVPLTPQLRLRWSWRVDELPSRLAEDTTLTHDYLSVALEFDDGQDLTWHWSAELPPGFAYRCPLEHWRHRETHIVVRSGTADLGRWLDEERPVLADHQVAIGGTAPARVVRAWLIAVSFFQHGTGRAEIGRFELVDGDRAVRVL